MSSEQHIPGTGFGELQLAIWTRQFEAQREGDRAFFLNEPSLQIIEQRYGVIEMNSNATGLQDDRVPDRIRVGMTRKWRP